MRSQLQATLLWIAAAIITLASVMYQRKTGPTYPVEGIYEFADQSIHYFFPRSQNTGENAEIVIEPSEYNFNAMLMWKRYKSHDDWMITPFTHTGDRLIAYLPSQPPAGKIIYRVKLRDDQGRSFSLTADPVTIRFKGEVPPFILIPHILAMFTAMLLATRTGLAALASSPRLLRYTFLTGLFLFIGGLILGPIVQKYAFDAFWTGWPWGHDLTDNKTAVAFISWLMAFWKQKKHGQAKSWIVAAAVITLAVYLIPHSAFGSELDYTNME